MLTNKDIDSALLDAEMFAERIDVMMNDLSQSYFNRTVKGLGDYREIAHLYYRIASVKSDIANNICSDLLQSLKVLRELIENGNDSSDDETEGGEQE